MNQTRVALFGALVALILFSSLCLFTVAPYEYAIVEAFGAQAEPCQIFGDKPSYVVTAVANPSPRWGANGAPVPRDAVFSSEQFDELPTTLTNAAGKNFEGAKIVRAEGDKAIFAVVDGSGAPLLEARRNPLGTGLYLKWPSPLNRVRRFSNRLNVFKESLSEMQTRSNEPIMIQPYLLWQVHDPVQFWKSVGGDEAQIDEKLEARLRSVLTTLIGQKYGIEDFYSLDPLKSRELRERQAERLLAVVASDEVAAGINTDVEDFRLKRLLGRSAMTFGRHKALSAAAAAAKLPAESPEIAEIVQIESGHIRNWLDLQLQAGGSGRFADAARALKTETDRQFDYLSDKLKRDSGADRPAADALRKFARIVAAEDMLKDLIANLTAAASQASSEQIRAQPGSLDSDSAWSAFWEGGRVGAAKAQFDRDLARLAKFAGENWGWGEADHQAVRDAAARNLSAGAAAEQMEALLLAEQAPNRTPEDRARKAQLQQRSAFLDKMLPRIAGAVNERMKAAKPTPAQVDTEALFQLLLAGEMQFLAREAELRTALDKNTAVEERRLILRDLETGAAVRAEREGRFKTRMAGVPAAEAADLERRARQWAKWASDVNSQAEARRRKLQEIRGYPRETVDQLRASIRSLEARLSEVSLAANNTVQIARMEQEVREILNSEMIAQYGVIIREVGFRRLSFPPTVSVAVYNRMKSERQRVAQTIQAMGELDKSLILSDAERRKQTLIAEANADALKTKGDGQAAAAKIIAETVEDKDAELFRLLSTLNTLEQMLNKPTTTLVIQAGPDNIFGTLFGKGVPADVGPAELERLGRKWREESGRAPKVVIPAPAPPKAEPKAEPVKP